MRIEAITLFRVGMELVTPHRTTNFQATSMDHIILRAQAEGGLVGWGECAAPVQPYYLGETFGTSWHMLEDFLIPCVLGKSWETIEQFALLYDAVKANTSPKAGLEMVAWDLLARAAGASVAKLLGGTRSEVAAGVTIGADKDRGRLLDAVGRAVDEGYERLKLKIGPGHDIEVMDAVRTRFPTARLMVDANSTYTIADVAHLKQLDAFDLMMIEQPFGPSDYLEHAELQRAITTPVCLDESIRSFEDARLALKLESCRVVCVKLASVGGLLPARRIHDLCREHGVALWCGGMLEFGIGRAGNLALASLPGFTLPSDVATSDRYFVEDLVEPAIRSPRGKTTVLSEPGFGYAPIESRIESRATVTKTFRA